MPDIYDSDDQLPALYEAVRGQLDVSDPYDMAVITVQHQTRPNRRSAWYVAGYLAGRLDADQINGYTVTPEIADTTTDFVVCAKLLNDGI